ncbi:uncharacterized protein LOC111114887 isoform X4 [Crassostrea virginica]
MKLACLLEGRRHKRSTARNRMQKTEHTKDPLLDYAASDNTSMNGAADGVHTKLHMGAHQGYTSDKLVVYCDG